MVEIRNRDEIFKLIDNYPVSDIVTLGTRAALRIFTEFGDTSEEIYQIRRWRDLIIAPAWRILVISANYGKHRRYNASFNYDEAHINILIAQEISEKIRHFTRVLYCIDGTTWGGLEEQRPYIPQAISEGIFESFGFASIHVKRNDPEHMRPRVAFERDITALEAGIDLWSQSLWLDDTPEWAVRGWETLATELTRRAPHWKTLVRWYEDRLHGDDWAAAQGRPAIPELEIARASLPDSYWKKGGRAVNEAIAALEAFFWEDKPLQDPVLRGLVGQAGVITEEPVEDIEVVGVETDEVPGWVPYDYQGEPELSVLPSIDLMLAQISSAIQFSGPADGPIDLAPPKPDDTLDADPARLEDFAELRHKAADLASEGINRLGRLGVPLDRFLALGGELSGIRAKLLWSRINTFRIVLQGHRDAIEIAQSGGERDERQLDGVVADKLTDLVETSNLFVIGDPVLLELDARRSGPRELTTAKVQLQVIAPVLRLAAVDPLVTAPSAGDVISEQAQNVLTAEDTLAGRQAAALGSNTTRNFVSTLLGRSRAALKGAKSEVGVAWKGYREGLYRAPGTATFALILSEGSGVTNFHTLFLQFVADNAEALAHYARLAFNNPEIEHFINFVATVFQ